MSYTHPTNISCRDHHKICDLKSNSLEGYVREVWILDGDDTVYYSFASCFDESAHTAIVSLMPTEAAHETN